MACGCKRSPTGKCIGWHRLTEEEYEVKLAGYNDIKQQLDIAKKRLEVAEAEPAMPPIKLPDSVIPIELYELNILISKFDLNIDEYQYIRDLPNIIHNIEDIIDKSLDLFMNSKITRKENSKIIREEVKDYIKLIKLNLELLEKPDEDRRWANYDEEGNPVKRGYNSAIEFFRKKLIRE